MTVDDKKIPEQENQEPEQQGFFTKLADGAAEFAHEHKTALRVFGGLTAAGLTIASAGAGAAAGAALVAVIEGGIKLADDRVATIKEKRDSIKRPSAKDLFDGERSNEKEAEVKKDKGPGIHPIAASNLASGREAHDKDGAARAG